MTFNINSQVLHGHLQQVLLKPTLPTNPNSLMFITGTAIVPYDPQHPETTPQIRDDSGTWNVGSFTIVPVGTSRWDYSLVSGCITGYVALNGPGGVKVIDVEDSNGHALQGGDHRLQISFEVGVLKAGIHRIGFHLVIEGNYLGESGTEFNSYQ